MVLIMQMVIFCGGLATRLGNLAKNTPKSMINIDSRPFLEHQINMLKKQNITDIILCVGHLSEQIESYFKDGEKQNVNIKYSYDGEKALGPIGALKNAEHFLKDDFFIMYGDSYLSVDFKKVFDFYKKHDKPACMVVYKNQNKYDKSNLIIKDNIAVGYGDSQRTDEMIYIDYGTSILNKKTLDLVPKNTFFSTGEFFSKLIKRKELLTYESAKRFYHIGNPEALEELREHIKNSLL